MNPGQLRKRISIIVRVNTLNAATGRMNTVTETRWANVPARRQDATTREIWEAYAAKARTIVNWEIRPLPGIRAGMFVVCEGAEYEIIATQHAGGIPGSMILKTTLKEAK